MDKHRGKSGRRSAAEWARLVDEWTKSGLSPAEFGAKHGIAGARLTWWRWHLAKTRTRSRRRAPRAAVKLVKLDVVPDSRMASQWEVRTAAGDALHVSESLTSDELEMILRAFGLLGRQR